MTNEDRFENYLLDLIVLLKERAQDARASRDKLRVAAGGARVTNDETKSAFEEGRAMGYYEVISLIWDQAHAFGLPLDRIALSDIVPNRDFT